jgi:hypothetical protein
MRLALIMYTNRMSQPKANTSNSLLPVCSYKKGASKSKREKIKELVRKKETIREKRRCTILKALIKPKKKIEYMREYHKQRFVLERINGNKEIVRCKAVRMVLELYKRHI